MAFLSKSFQIRVILRFHIPQEALSFNKNPSVVLVLFTGPSVVSVVHVNTTNTVQRPTLNYSIKCGLKRHLKR